MQLIDRIEVGVRQPRNIHVLWVDTVNMQIKWGGNGKWQNLVGKDVQNTITDIIKHLTVHDEDIKNLQDADIVITDKLNAHIADLDNPHHVTKEQVGLGNVTDEAQIPLSQKGVAGGVATLDDAGLVPSAQLPSYVDDVLEFATSDDFPAEGENGKIYVSLDTNLTYRWSGTQYVEISKSLALGETSTTAYPGDKGKQNADNIEKLTKTVYTNHIYGNISVSPNIIYKGVSSDITINYSGGISGSDEVPKFILKKAGATVEIPSGGKDSVTLNDTTPSMTYTVDVSAGGVKKSVDATVKAYWPIYTFGAVGKTVSALPSGAKMQPVVSSPKGQSYSYTVNQDEYIFIAFPEEMSINGAESSGFDIGITDSGADITIEGKGKYHVYRTQFPQDAGDYDVTFK